MTNIADTLAALSAKATQGEWSITAYYTGTGPDERCCGMVQVDDYPNGVIDEEPATAESLSPNLEFIVALVNAFRAGQLVPVPSVEAAVSAVYDSMEGWNNVVELGLLPPQHHDTARSLSARLFAIIAAMKGETK